jgi:hypothetical protein
MYVVFVSRCQFPIRYSAAADGAISESFYYVS